jgi:hypothetical protein
MAKTESTAVNQLIELQQTATPLKPDPTDDLMFRAPPKKAARLTSTVPSLKADVPPLPRMRAPQGTQSQGVPTIPPMPPTKPSVRMHTATHPITMPEVQPWAQSAPAEGSGEMDVITDVRNQSVAPQPLKPALPPPRPSAPPPIPRTSVAMRAEAPKPFPAPEAIAYPSAAPYLSQVAADMTSHQPWFDEAQPASAPIEVDVDLGTDRVRSSKATDWKTLLPKLIAPTLGLCIVGMFVGGFLAFNGQSKKSTAAPTTVAIKATPPVADKPTPPVADKAPIAVPEIKAAPKQDVKVVAEVKETTPPNLAPHATTPAITTDAKAAPVAPGARPAFVDVRLDSTPSGATVTLIDRGKSTFLGTTPISTALDPSRQYDLVFSHASKPTQVEHLDPSVTKRLAIVLGKSAKPAVAAETPKAAVAPKKLEAKQVEVPKATKVEPKKVVADAPKPEVKAEEPKKAVVDPVDPFDPPKAAPKGDGVLMVSSKPPCEIVVDGVPTGLTTPQRALKLPAGTHKITLINGSEKIKKTVTVTITADQPTKVIENFMK